MVNMTYTACARLRDLWWGGVFDVTHELSNNKCIYMQGGDNENYKKVLIKVYTLIISL